MRFPDSFLNELKARLRPSDIIGRKVKLKKQGKEWVGLSPFTAEKTPSFYVNDQKQFFKCFSSGKFGDIITFLMETERLQFNEAVERLAGEAGLPLPIETPEDKKRRSVRAQAIDLLEAVTDWFERSLRGPEGAKARDYLIRRGLPEAAWSRHRIGYAPGGWRTLREHFQRAGYSEEQLLAAGLIVRPDTGRDSYDRFRNRVMFPIADATGKIIAFGGRALDSDDKPKYLNSPETDLFHKGDQLYRYRAAREALANKDGAGLIVCEGYMDAIALAEAGFGEAVAPLGTALTDTQLDLLWRAGSEPTLCFDGDAAGQRAAYSALDRALPHITPEKTLAVCLLPDGKDPDDLIQAEGAGAMGEALAAAQPFVEMLWTRELHREPLNTPEHRAGLEGRVNKLVATIQHEGLQRAYRDELRQRVRDHLFAQRRGGRDRPKGATAPLPKSRPARRIRGTATLIRMVDSPRLLEYGYEALLSARFDHEDVAALRDGILHVLSTCGEVDRADLTRHLEQTGNVHTLDLLRQYPAQTPLDPDSNDGQHWLASLEHYGAADELSSDLKRLRDRASDPVAPESVNARRAVRAELRRMGSSPADDSRGAGRDSADLRDALMRNEEVVRRKSGTPKRNQR